MEQGNWVSAPMISLRIVDYSHLGQFEMGAHGFEERREMDGYKENVHGPKVMLHQGQPQRE